MPSAPAPVEPVTEPSEAAARLRLSTTRLARRLRQEAGAGLTPSQLSALASVVYRGPMTLGSLADYERVAPPSITKIVNNLETQGLVVRTGDADDRRITWVTASEAGEELVAESRQRKTAWLASRIELLDADQRRRLADALDVLDALATDSGGQRPEGTVDR
jgi:DNA-binding MarR family transcriptional regulator